VGSGFHGRLGVAGWSGRVVAWSSGGVQVLTAMLCEDDYVSVS
jgi:hypothetical protein